jgi:hypothetical protein
VTILQRELGNTADMADVAGLEISKPATFIDGAKIGSRTGSLYRFWVLSGTQGGGVCATPTLGPSSQGGGSRWLKRHSPGRNRDGSRKIGESLGKSGIASEADSSVFCRLTLLISMG